MENLDNMLINAALEYAGHGFSVIPTQKNKKPYIKWTEFQHRKATVEEIRQWWGKWPNAMIGIVTGQISDLFVVDCDTEEGYKSIKKILPDTLIMPTARTPRGGWHFYFQYPTDLNLPSKAEIIPGVDIRGKGGYIIAAPSMNGNGKGYEWLDGLSLPEVALPQIPDAILNVCNKENIQEEVTKKETDFKREQNHNGKEKGTFVLSDLYKSPAFIALRGVASQMLINILGKRIFNKPNKKSDTRICVNADVIKLSYIELKKLGITQPRATRGFDALLAKGFIVLKHHGGAYQKDQNIYSLSNQFLLWKKGKVFSARPDELKKGFQNSKQK